MGVTFRDRSAAAPRRPRVELRIKRTGRVACRYGVRKNGTATVVPIEVGLSSYADAGSAADRISFTVSQQRSAGALPTEIDLSKTKGTVLSAPTSCLLVFAKDVRTVAITVAKEVAVGEQAAGIVAKIGASVESHLS